MTKNNKLFFINNTNSYAATVFFLSFLAKIDVDYEYK